MNIYSRLQHMATLSMYSRVPPKFSALLRISTVVAPKFIVRGLRQAPKLTHRANLASCEMLQGSKRYSVLTYSRGKDKPITREAAVFPGMTRCAQHWARRVHCSEFQMLNLIHSERLISADRLSELFIYSERPPCRSCQRVIHQFKQRYRHCKIKVSAA